MSSCPVSTVDCTVTIFDLQRVQNILPNVENQGVLDHRVCLYRAIFKFPLSPNRILYPTIILNICSTEESWLLNAHYNAFLGAVHVCKLKLPIVSRVVGDVFLCAALPPRRSTNQKREQVWADQSWCRLAVEDDCFFSMESLKENHGYVHWGPPLHYTSQSVKFLSSVHLSQEKSHDSNGLFTYYYGKD